MKSDLEVFGSDEPMTGLLAIGCSNDDPDPYAPPVRQPTLNVPDSIVMLPPRSNLNRTALTSHNIMNDTVGPRGPVQIGKALHIKRCMQKEVADDVGNIAGQYVDQQNLAEGSNRRGAREVSLNTNVQESRSNYITYVLHANRKPGCQSLRA